VFKTPKFWSPSSCHFLSDLLGPISRIYTAISNTLQKRQLRFQEKLNIPVICIGNATMGGTGKTPVAAALGRYIKEKYKKNIHFLSRGYKGSVVGPLQVDCTRHSYREVGDEPLLLSEIAPVWVSKDKVKGGLKAQEQGAELLIMDDGLQNQRLYKDLSILVIDGAYGFGNERVFPAGPLREPIPYAFEKASILLMVGEDKMQLVRRFSKNLPILTAGIQSKGIDTLKSKNILAFCGIGRPEKFFTFLEEQGIHVQEKISFPDHYVYKDQEIENLIKKANEKNLCLTTTRKDSVRIATRYHSSFHVIDIEVVFHDYEALDSCLRSVL
jgi:tetraacyldisaccharide 4'-kinase